MNKTILIGRLTKEVELRYTGNNTPVATFSIAVNRDFTNQDGEREADFFNIVAWRKQGENCKRYLTKGSQVAIEGRLQNRSYDGQDGQKRYITEVIAESVEFLSTKSSENSNNVEEPQPTNKQDNLTNACMEFGQQIEIDESEYPF